MRNDTTAVEKQQVRRCCDQCGEPIRSLSWLWCHYVDEHPKAAMDWFLSDWGANVRAAMRNKGRYGGLETRDSITEETEVSPDE